MVGVSGGTGGTAYNGVKSSSTLPLTTKFKNHV
jgi:hypothetical protein